MRVTDFILEISCDPSREDEIHGRLFLTRSTGSSTSDGIVSAYFASAAERDDAARLFENFTVRHVERTGVDWLDRYQQSLRPLLIGQHFIIAPDPALLPSDSRRHRLIVPQEQAFGTGSHESTALSIELLEEMDLRDAQGLDIGAGSGILALAMLALGVRRVIAFDVDVDTFAALRQNRARNRFAAQQMPIFIGSTASLRGGQFDVVTMNILPEVIIPLLPELRRHVGGALIVSGILTTWRDDVISAAHRCGFRLEREREKGEWWAGSFRLTAP
jgi:ribosomal protein L11 methyltransferase